jgi:hypothetical protein
MLMKQRKRKVKENLFRIKSTQHCSLAGLTVFEVTKKREGDKRKRHRNADPGDIEGYLGPWGKFVDEKTVAQPTEVVFQSFP